MTSGGWNVCRLVGPRIQINLANSLMRLAETGGDVKLARDAVEVCRLAIVQWPREKLAVDWATGQVNLGTALLTFGRLADNPEAVSYTHLDVYKRQEYEALPSQ